MFVCLPTLVVLLRLLVPTVSRRVSYEHAKLEPAVNARAGPAPADAALAWVGCFAGNDVRFRPDDKHHSVRSCNLACTNFTYFALQDRGQCLCGDKKPQKQVHPFLCGRACHKDRTQVYPLHCGGKGAQAVYQAGFEDVCTLYNVDIKTWTRKDFAVNGRYKLSRSLTRRLAEFMDGTPVFVHRYLINSLHGGNVKVDASNFMSSNSYYMFQHKSGVWMIGKDFNEDNAIARSPRTVSRCPPNSGWEFRRHQTSDLWMGTNIKVQAEGKKQRPISSEVVDIHDTQLSCTRGAGVIPGARSCQRQVAALQRQMSKMFQEKLSVGGADGLCKTATLSFGGDLPVFVPEVSPEIGACRMANHALDRLLDSATAFHFEKEVFDTSWVSKGVSLWTGLWGKLKDDFTDTARRARVAVIHPLTQMGEVLSHESVSTLNCCGSVTQGFWSEASKTFLKENLSPNMGIVINKECFEGCERPLRDSVLWKHELPTLLEVLKDSRQNTRDARSQFKITIFDLTQDGEHHFVPTANGTSYGCPLSDSDMLIGDAAQSILDKIVNTLHGSPQLSLIGCKMFVGNPMNPNSGWTKKCLDSVNDPWSATDAGVVFKVGSSRRRTVPVCRGCDANYNARLPIRRSYSGVFEMINNTDDVADATDDRPRYQKGSKHLYYLKELGRWVLGSAFNKSSDIKAYSADDHSWCPSSVGWEVRKTGSLQWAEISEGGLTKVSRGRSCAWRSYEVHAPMHPVIQNSKLKGIYKLIHLTSPVNDNRPLYSNGLYYLFFDVQHEGWMIGLDFANSTSYRAKASVSTQCPHHLEGLTYYKEDGSKSQRSVRVTKAEAAGDPSSAQVFFARLFGLKVTAKHMNDREPATGGFSAGLIAGSLR